MSGRTTRALTAAFAVHAGNCARLPGTIGRNDAGSWSVERQTPPEGMANTQVKRNGVGAPSPGGVVADSIEIHAAIVAMDPVMRAARLRGDDGVEKTCSFRAGAGMSGFGIGDSILIPGTEAVSACIIQRGCVAGPGVLTSRPAARRGLP